MGLMLFITIIKAVAYEFVLIFGGIIVWVTVGCAIIEISLMLVERIKKKLMYNDQQVMEKFEETELREFDQIIKETKRVEFDQIIKETKRVDDFGAFKERFYTWNRYLGRLKFAVCDSFDIQGYITGFGNPDWERTHEPATQTSDVVAHLINRGFILIGKTVVSDMALSITGENCHYGTPTNPAAPELIPGGVSSGASVVAAAKLVDFSLGIDTDGGVRVAAGYCGACGFRPTHGIVSLSGVIPVSKSLDTLGWFAKNTKVLEDIGSVVLHNSCQTSYKNLRPFLIAEDCFSLAKFPLTHLVVNTIESMYGSYALERVDLGEYLVRDVPSLKRLRLKKSGGDRLSSHPITVLANAMQKLKRYEFRRNHSEWIDSVKPKLSWGQVSETRGLLDSEVKNCYKIRSEMWSSFIKGSEILVIPTCIYPPSELGAKETLSEDYLIRMSALSSLASMSGCCEVVIPVGVYKNMPVSISLLAMRGGDKLLLRVADEFHLMLQEKVREVTMGLAMVDNANGHIAFLSKNWQKAVECYTAAIKLNGSNAMYYNDRAAAYFEMKSYGRVEADCTKAIELDKKLKTVNRTQSVEAYIRRGTIRYLLHTYNGAKEDFSRALSLDPTNNRAYEALQRMG